MQHDFRKLADTAADESQVTSAQTLRSSAGVGAQFVAAVATDTEDHVPSSLELVVTSVATQLMAVNAATSAQVSQTVLADLVEYFDVDVSFLRHNDHRIRASRLVAEWPVRPGIPDPDPLGVVYFADADPVFALAEHAEGTHRLPSGTGHRRLPDARSNESRQRRQRHRWRAYRWCPATSRPACSASSSSATATWTPEELNALKAIASLFAQLQARVLAEDQLRYLAEHDDLTGLHNRRALLAHLDARLAAGQPGPVSALFFDLDRLKAINDYLGHTAGDWFIRVLAERLREGAGGPNLIARLGGDEFVVVPAAPMDADTAEALAYRLQSTLRERVAIDGEMLTRTVSIGVALACSGP